MNKLILLPLFLLLWSVSLFAAGDQYAIGVDGLACPFCAYGVEKQLDKLGGIERMETDIQNGLVLLTMKEGSILEEASAREAVSRAGFTLRSFRQNEE